MATRSQLPILLIFLDIGLSPSTTYAYTVSAYDYPGNESAQSTPASATTQAAGEPVYTILKARISPTLDGNLAEYTHANAIDFSLSIGGNRVNIKALWDSEALYLGFEVTDTQLDAIETSRDGRVWAEDAIEWFIDTHNNGGGLHTNSKYMLDDDYHGIVNILNTQYDSRGTASGTPLKNWNGTWESVVIPNRGNNNTANSDSGYTIEIKIPWTTIGFKDSPPDEANVGMSFVIADKDGASFNSYMWLNQTGTYENASKWQQVLLSSQTADSDKDTAPPSPPTGIKVTITNR